MHVAARYAPHRLSPLDRGARKVATSETSKHRYGFLGLVASLGDHQTREASAEPPGDPNRRRYQEVAHSPRTEAEFRRGHIACHRREKYIVEKLCLSRSQRTQLADSSSEFKNARDHGIRDSERGNPVIYK